jgi:hypothetical protein
MTQAGDGEEKESGEARPAAGRRPPHLITREEAGAWLAGSAVQSITVHCTYEAAARNIEARGVDIGSSDRDVGWGQWFYTTTRPHPRYGEAYVPVAVRLMHPLVLPDTVQGAEIMDELAARIGTDEPRDAVLAAGFDGVVLHLDPDEVWMIAYRNDRVRVVVGAGRGG